MQLTSYLLADKMPKLPNFEPMLSSNLVGKQWGVVDRITLPEYEFITIRVDERKLNDKLLKVELAAINPSKHTKKDVKEQTKLKILSQTLPTPEFFNLTINRKTLIMTVEGGKHDFLLDNLRVQLQENELVTENFKEIFKTYRVPYITHIKLESGNNTLQVMDFDRVDVNDGVITQIGFNLTEGDFTLRLGKTNQLFGVTLSVDTQNEYEEASKIEKVSLIESIVKFVQKL